MAFVRQKSSHASKIFCRPVDDTTAFGPVNLETFIALTNDEAELKFLPNISKYTTELTMVVGIALISALQFARYDANRAIAVLSVFLAASTRIAPAVMRLQQNAITLKTYLASSEPTLSLAEDLRKSKKLENLINKLEIDHLGFEPSISFGNVTFRYESSSVDAVKNLSFEVQAGKMIAIVGIGI
jgi:ABC-type multidrug transport system fused ATPase/permease subunit